MKRVGDKIIIELQFSEEDYCKLWRYEIYIRDKIKKGDKVNNRVLKRYLGLLHKPLLDAAINKEAIIDRAKNTTFETLKKYKQSFSFTTPSIAFTPPEFVEKKRSKKRAGTMSITSESFIHSFFNELYYEEEIEPIISNRTKMTEYVARKMLSYINHIPVDEKEYPTLNKQHIITGCIMLSFGLINDEKTFKKSPSNNQYYTEYLSSTTKHAYNKIHKSFKIKK